MQCMMHVQLAYDHLINYNGIAKIQPLWKSKYIILYGKSKCQPTWTNHMIFCHTRVHCLHILIIFAYLLQQKFQQLFDMCATHLGNPNFLDATKNCYPPARLSKNHCPCILKGHISTNSILSSLHLQGPKSNIYVHFHWVISNWLGFHFQREIAKRHVINLEVKIIQNPH